MKPFDGISPLFFTQKAVIQMMMAMLLSRSLESHITILWYKGYVLFLLLQIFRWKIKERYYLYINYNDHLIIKLISGSFLIKDLEGNKRALHVFNIIWTYLYE